MIIFKKIKALRDFLEPVRITGSIGFVPTMGALHEGHLSLVETCRNENTVTVSSIFVNPAQFNDPKDFLKYPVTIEKDIQRLHGGRCDILFLPDQQEIYPPGINKETVDLARLDQVLEGKFRPGHFQGVCKVVNRLLEIVEPHRLYLGQKDYQQCMVIRRLLDITGRTTTLNICATVREPDGLAMSSRNLRLTAEDRRRAPAIYQALEYCKNNLVKGNLSDLKQSALRMLSEQGFRIDYLEIADAVTLELLTQWDGKQDVVALIAAFIGDVRLIDNMVLSD